MNTERIRELAEQASHQSPDGYPVTIPYSKDFAKKFAELIAAEEREACALAVEQAGIEGLGTLAAAAVIRERGEEEEYEDPNDYRGMGWVGQDGRP